MFFVATDNPTIMAPSRASLPTTPFVLLLALLIVTFCTGSGATDTITVDGKTVKYWPSTQEGLAPIAGFSFDSKRYRNVYTLDCQGKRFIWTANFHLATGKQTGNARGAEWKPLNPKSTISNAVYEAFCPQLLADNISAPASNLYTPQKWNPERKAIMDAVRDRYSNKKVLFLVHYLKVGGDWAWARANASESCEILLKVT